MIKSNRTGAARIMRPIEPVLLHDRVYDALKAAVMAGHFIPGQRVVVREVAEQFETSPMPVREAIRRLIALRALVSAPNRTVHLPEFSPDTVRDLCRVRVGVEGMATEWAAANATPKLIEQLQKFQRREVDTHAKGDFAGMLEANRRFHFSIYEAAGSKVLLPCLEMFWLQIGPYFGILEGHPSQNRYHGDHARIIDYMKRGDGSRARACIAQHITAAADDIIAAWPKQDRDAARRG